MDDDTQDLSEPSVDSDGCWISATRISCCSLICSAVERFKYKSTPMARYRWTEEMRFSVPTGAVHSRRIRFGRSKHEGLGSKGCVRRESTACGSSASRIHG